MINDIRATAKSPAPAQTQTRPATSPPRAYRKPAPTTRRRSMPGWLQVLLAVPLILFGSLFIQSAALGQAAIVVYGIVAYLTGIPSRTTFILVLLSTIATLLLLVGKGDLALAQNFATYTFLFLVAGVVTLGRELKKEGGRIYSNRRQQY